jgi:DNA-binding response OmpR family regulator
MLNIVLIEDHNSLRIVTVNVLRQHGYSVIGLACAEDLDDSVGTENVDIYVIDLNLPDEDGISLTKRIRKSNLEVGIIITTARKELKDKVLGYESGADIYLAKPVSHIELLAAISALSRRVKTKTQATDLWLDSSRLILYSEKAQVRLNQSEVIILQVLSRAKNQKLEYWQLLEVIGTDQDCTKSHLDVKIHRIRQKIIQLGIDKPSIKNLRQYGYELCVTLNIRQIP